MLDFKSFIILWLRVESLLATKRNYFTNFEYFELWNNWPIRSLIAHSLHQYFSILASRWYICCWSM